VPAPLIAGKRGEFLEGIQGAGIEGRGVLRETGGEQSQEKLGDGGDHGGTFYAGR
jgi:hypothetical protein